MAVYTCFDMVRDCREGKPSGWTYFVRTFVAPLTAMTRHYSRGPERGREMVERILEDLRRRENSVWTQDAIGERGFLALVRPLVVDAAGWATEDPAVPLDLATLESALEPLTVVERQIAWFGAMGYDDGAASVIMRVSPETAGKVRERAAELLRARMDHWTRTVVESNGPSLQREALAARPEQPIGVRDFLDVLDGRITWAQHQKLDGQLAASWHEIDHFCRIREADHWMRVTPPLDAAEAAAWLRAVGVEPAKPSWLKRWLK